MSEPAVDMSSIISFNVMLKMRSKNKHLVLQIITPRNVNLYSEKARDVVIYKIYYYATLYYAGIARAVMINKIIYYATLCYAGLV